MEVDAPKKKLVSIFWKIFPGEEEQNLCEAFKKGPILMLYACSQEKDIEMEMGDDYVLDLKSKW